MRKATFGSFVVSTIAGIVVACGGSDGSSSGILDADGGASSSSGGSSSGGSSGTASSSGGTSGVFTPAQAGQGTAFCDGTYKQITDTLSRCCSEEDKQTVEYKLAAGLFGVAIQGCGPRIEGSIAKGRLEIDTAASQTCIGVWKALFAGACGGPLGTTPTAVTPEVTAQLQTCTVVWRGNVAEGGACAQSIDCVDGLACVGWTTNGDGTCKQPPAIGEKCGEGATEGGIAFDLDVPTSTHPKCATGAWCNKVCLAQSDPGGSCSKDEECSGGKKCHAGICGDVGDSDQNGSCKSNDDCKSGLYCQAPGSGQVGTCQPKQADGAACTSSVSSCKGRCDRPDSGTNGTCKTFCGSG